MARKALRVRGQRIPFALVDAITEHGAGSREAREVLSRLLDTAIEQHRSK